MGCVFCLFLEFSVESNLMYLKKFLIYRKLSDHHGCHARGKLLASYLSHSVLFKLNVYCGMFNTHTIPFTARMIMLQIRGIINNRINETNFILIRALT